MKFIYVKNETASFFRYFVKKNRQFQRCRFVEHIKRLIFMLKLIFQTEFIKINHLKKNYPKLRYIKLNAKMLLNMFLTLKLSIKVFLRKKNFALIIPYPNPNDGFLDPEKKVFEIK